jgi:glycosyltransferase involved in cell wall biosynthesis
MSADEHLEVFSSPTFSPNQIRIIHLSTSHEGGAAIAARRLCGNLNEIGVSSDFVTLAGKDFTPSLHEREIPRRRLAALIGKIASLIHVKVEGKTTFSIFSLGTVSLGSILNNQNPKITVINIHNWYNMLSLRQLRKIAKSNFQIVMTMHDMRIFTGGCHYSLDCRKFELGCRGCQSTNKIFERKIEHNFDNGVRELAKYPNVHFVAPSAWIAESLKRTNLIPRSRISVISNPHFLQLPTINPTTRDGNELIFGVANVNKNSYIKGSDLIHNFQVFLNASDKPMRLIHMSDFSQDSDGIEAFWSEINFLILFSRADNNPNVIHEAKIRGVRVIASDVGGIPEYLDPEIDLCISLHELENGLAFSKIQRWCLKEAKSSTGNVQSKDEIELGRVSLQSYLQLYLKKLQTQ